MCNKACSPQAFGFANLNLLTDDECRTLDKWVGVGGASKNFCVWLSFLCFPLSNLLSPVSFYLRSILEREGIDNAINFETELCAG